jgi:hypothetical protein
MATDWYIDEQGAHGNKLAPWYPPDRPWASGAKRMARSSSPWSLTWRDRLAWRLFRLTASPAMAHTVWDHYRWGRDSMEVTWRGVRGMHGQYATLPPEPVVSLIYWMTGETN